MKRLAILGLVLLLFTSGACSLNSQDKNVPAVQKERLSLDKSALQPIPQSIDVQLRRAYAVFEASVNGQRLTIPPRWWFIPYQHAFVPADHWLTPYRLPDGTDVDLLKPANPAPFGWIIMSPDTGQAFIFEADVFGGASGIGPARFERIGKPGDYLIVSWLAHWEQDANGSWFVTGDIAPNGRRYSLVANMLAKGKVDGVTFEVKTSAMGAIVGGPEN